MGQLAVGRIRVGSLWGALVLGFFSATVCLGAQAASREVNLYWTDPGLRLGQRPACLDQAAESMFRPFGDSVTPVFARIDPQRGTILIPMPRTEDRPTTDAEWSAFSTRLYQGILGKVQQGLRDNVATFEIRTVHDLGSLANLTAAIPVPPTAQQLQCVRFTEAFLTALDKVKQELARTEKVRVCGLVGRDAAYAATESISGLRRSPLDRLIVVGGTASVDRVVQTSAVMNGQLTLINTASDVLPSPLLVANLKGSQEAQRKDPRIRLLCLAPSESASSASVSAASFDPLMQPDVKVAVREFTRTDPQAQAPEVRDLPGTTTADLIGIVLAGAGQVGVLIPYGVSMGMKVAPGSFKEGKPGELEKIREETLKSRPPQGGATWPVPEKGWK